MAFFYDGETRGPRLRVASVYDKRIDRGGTGVPLFGRGEEVK